MIRALTTLVGLACSAALLLLVNDTGASEGGGLWKRAALFAAAGLVAGFFYQLGGIRRPGVRVNVPLFVGAFVPWTLLAVAICAQRAGTPVFLTDLVHDILPDSALERWSPSFPILAFMAGLLLAFALVEPLVQEHVRRERSSRNRCTRTTPRCGRSPWRPARDRPGARAPRPSRATRAGARRGLPRPPRSRAGGSSALPGAAR